MLAPEPSIFYLQKVETSPGSGLGENAFSFLSNNTGEQNT